MSIQKAPGDYNLAQEGDQWVATHIETGVASQGDDPNEAVQMAQDAVLLSQQEHEPADMESHNEMLREFGIDPEEVEFDSIETPEGMP